MISSRGSPTVSDPSEAFVRSVGAALRQIRKSQDLTQAELAARLQAQGMETGSSAKTVSAWERGDTPIPLPALPVIAEALRLEPRVLGQQLGLCGAANSREIHLADGADLLRQLEDEPPEFAEAVVRWWRESFAFARAARLARQN